MKSKIRTLLLVGFVAAILQTEFAYAQKIKLPSLIPFRQSAPQVEPIPLSDQAPSNGIFRVPNLFSGKPMPDLFPKPNNMPNPATMLERIQMNSQNFFRTTGESFSQFFQSTNQSLRNSSEQTLSWFRQSIPKLHWQPQSDMATDSVRPPMRSSLDPRQEPKVRF